MIRQLFCCLLAGWIFFVLVGGVEGDDCNLLQTRAIETGASPVAHWGPDPLTYSSWMSHTNRLIPVYTFGTRNTGKGIDLNSYTGENSLYRNEQRLKEMYGYLPTNTLVSDAEYMDQTDVFRLQQAAIEAGKRYVFLVVFDGFDWQTARAAAIYKSRAVSYVAGRGTGLHLQNYQAAGTTQLGFMVTSPRNGGTKTDVNQQAVLNPGGTLRGGYDPMLGGRTPWEEPTDDRDYLIGRSKAAGSDHVYTDSAASATSMTCGVKTYNDAVNLDHNGIPLESIAHLAQQKGYAVGVVTSVPISHATPAYSYAHNVHRDDYQDLSRDLLGLPSITHSRPLPGLDVLIGCGFGVEKAQDHGQGVNFVPGNRYLTATDLNAVNVSNGGKYIVTKREPGVAGNFGLSSASAEAIREHQRLFGFYGATGGGAFSGNLPLQGSARNYQPGPGRTTRDISYSAADLHENPTLAEMTTAAIDVLASRADGFWLMVEAGDVDWVNHDSNLDASIGAVLAGDDAVKVITDWVEIHGGWNDAVMIVTGDHGHYLVIDNPELLIPNGR